MNKDQMQQGDVILKKITELHAGVKKAKRDNGDIVLDYGEVTGHRHRICDVDAMFYEKDGMFYLKTDKPVTLIHEEHNQITVEPGIWQVGQVREKDWISGMVRRVID